MPTTSSGGLLLLDTHIWIWLVEGHRSLRANARDAIRNAASAGGLRIAAITLWEVALLSSRGRIVTESPIRDWLERALAVSGAVVEPLDPEVAIESWALPGQFHRDPADRMIAATARVTGAAVMTRDRRILDYAKQGHVSAISA